MQCACALKCGIIHVEVDGQVNNLKKEVIG